MVKHIVMWKLRETAGGRNKKENALEVKRLLESLNGRVPGLVRLEVGINFCAADGAADIVLYAEFENKWSLDAYQHHPCHLKVKAFVKTVRAERYIVDYEA